MSKIFIIAAQSNKTVPTKKIKCFFNKEKWGEAVRACYNRNLPYIAIGCEIQSDDVNELVPTEWYGRFQRPFSLEQLEQHLVKIAEWKFGRSAVFNASEDYEKAQSFGEI